MPNKQQDNSVIPTEENQLDMLRTYLATSEPFRQFRGRFKKILGTGIFEEKGFEDASPTKILNEFTRRQGHAKILLNKLATLRRDGYMRAAEEFDLALNDPTFVITGEEWPLDKRTPGVLLMYEPKRMLDMLRWLKLVDPRLVDKYLGHPYPDNEFYFSRGMIKDRVGYREWTEQIMKDNPELTNGLNNFYTKSGTRFRRTEFLARTLMPGVFDKFPKDDDSKWRLERRDVRWLRIEEVHDYSSEEMMANWSVACFLPNMTQQQVLSMIKREHQDEVATWQFHYPSHIRDFSKHTGSIGLFPEKEFERYKRQWPTHVSNSRNQGMGAVLLESRYHLKMDDSSFDLDYWRKMDEEPKKEDISMRLHFPD